MGYGLESKLDSWHNNNDTLHDKMEKYLSFLSFIIFVAFLAT